MRNIEVRDFFPVGPLPTLGSPPPIPPVIGDRRPVGDRGLVGDCSYDDDGRVPIGPLDDVSARVFSGVVLARVNTVGLGFVSLDETEPGEDSRGPEDADIASESGSEVI